MSKSLRVGVLCYSLNHQIVATLNRLQNFGDIQVKAYPIVKADCDLKCTFQYRETKSVGRFIYLNNRKRDAPDIHLISFSYTSIREMVRESNVVVLTGLQSVAALCTALLANKCQKPIIALLQSMRPEAELNRPWIIRFFKKWLLNHVNQYVIQTPPTFETLHQVYKLPNTKMVSAPYSAGAETFQNYYNNFLQSRESLRMNFGVEDKVVFLFVGSVLHLKGVDLLLRAFTDLQSEHKNLILWIIGASPEERDFQRQARSLGLTDSTFFWGQVDSQDLPRFYRAADVFVLPTRKDMWPKVLMEAALSELPLITTDRCGSAGHLVRDGLNGFIARTDDIASLHDAMHKLLDPDLRLRMSKQSILLAHEMFDIEAEIVGLREAIFRAANLGYERPS